MGLVRAHRALTKSNLRLGVWVFRHFENTPTGWTYKLPKKSGSLYVHTNVLEVQTNTNIYIFQLYLFKGGDQSDGCSHTMKEVWILAAFSIL